MSGAYENVYTNEYVNFYSIISQHVLTASSIAMNLILIYCIAIGNRKDIGNYRILLTCFAINDLIYTTTHYLTYPVPETYHYTILFRSHGPLTSQIAICLYVANYGTSFPLLAAHFAYRALVLKWSRFSLHFSQFLATTITATLVVAGCWFYVAFVCFAADGESRVIMEPLISGEESSPVVHSNETKHLYHFMGTFWTEGDRDIRWNIIKGAAILLVTLTAVYGTISTCSCMIIGHVRTNAMSASTMRLQQQLFRCLVYQTAFPMITALCPAIVCIFAPILGFSWAPIPVIIPNFCVIHPLFDGAVVLLNVTEYRKVLLRHLRCGRFEIKQPSNPTASISTDMPLSKL